MADITANVVVSMPSQLFTASRIFRALAGGRIYIGMSDTDPVIPANQIQVYLENEDGSYVPVSQPLLINAAGYPVYNGQIAKFVTVQNHSMAVYDFLGVQQFYFPDILKYDPDQLRAELVTEGTPVLVDDSRIGVKNPDANSVSRTQHDKNAEIVTPADFATMDAMIASLVESGKSAAVFNSYHAFTVTAGTGGDYETLLEALIAAQAMRPLYDDGAAFCEIKLKTGYVLDSQIEFGAGADLSWIKITSEDTVVYSNTTSFTKSIRTYYEYKYLFYMHGAFNSPVFAIQIQENRSNSEVCAFVVTEGAQLNFAPYSGARKFYVGCHATYGAKVIAQHTGCAADAASVALYKPAGYYVCDFSDSLYTSISVMDQSIVHMPISKFDRCPGEQGSVFVVYNAIANFHGCSAKDCYVGWNIRDGAHVNMRDHTTTNCTSRGLTTIHTVFVDARRHDTEESIEATSGQVLDSGAQNGFYGCVLGVRADGAGFIDVAGNDMRNCGTAINADTGAVISGKAVDISGSTLGFDCHAGGITPFPRLWAKNVAKLMHLQDGAKFFTNIFHVSGKNPTTDIRWIDIERADASFYNGTIDANSGIIADCGSRITIEGSSSTQTTAIKVQTIRSFYGSNVAVFNCTADRSYADTADVPQLIISGGSFISATGYLNGDGSNMRINVARNTLSAGGIIFHPNGVVS